MELYHKYDSSEMAFNPPIPAPKGIEFKDIKGRHFWNQRSVEKQCEEALHCRLTSERGYLDFATDYRNTIKRKRSQ